MLRQKRVKVLGFIKEHLGKVVYTDQRKGNYIGIINLLMFSRVVRILLLFH